MRTVKGNQNFSTEDILNVLEKLLSKEQFLQVEDLLEDLAISRKTFQDKLAKSEKAERVSHEEVKKMIQ